MGRAALWVFLLGASLLQTEAGPVGDHDVLFLENIVKVLKVMESQRSSHPPAHGKLDLLRKAREVLQKQVDPDNVDYCAVERDGCCMPTSWLCDGFADCDGGWDEDVAVCQAEACSAGEFKCLDNGHCLPGFSHCDGWADCEDASDESAAECGARTCGADSFACAQNNMCLPPDWECDGWDDCKDGSDEPASCGGRQAASLAAKQIGAEDTFTCTDGTEYLGSYTCDNYPDCSDASDEAASLCGPRQCEAEEFACATTNMCIFTEWVCDEWDDCADGSDEAACSAVKHNSGSKTHARSSHSKGLPATRSLQLSRTQQVALARLSKFAGSKTLAASDIAKALADMLQ